MKNPRALLALGAGLLALPAPAQIYIAVPHTPGQTKSQDRLAAFERRLTEATGCSRDRVL